MRLTHKYKYKADNKRFVFDMKDYRKACQKFGQLEDIEEELGIDLITYVKATTQPILYIKNVPFDNEIKAAFMEAITIDDMTKDYLIWFSCGKGKRYLFLIKDYGKTWALTKEELL